MSKISVALFQHLVWLLCLIGAVSAVVNSTAAIPSDAVAILAFKAKADVRREVLRFSRNSTSRFCRWRGIQCYPGGDKVVRLVLHSLDLGGVFAADTLSRLDQLRVLSLQNDSLYGPIPDLSALKNLKTLFLDHNSFSGAFPPSILLLHRIRTVDFSSNNLTKALPAGITSLDRLISLRLDHNRLTGEIPAMNQTSLTSFNVSGNDFTGAVPVTLVLLRLDASSFSSNPSLCGEIVHKECATGPPFFGTPTGSPSVGEVTGVEQSQPRESPHGRRSGTAMIALFSAAAAAVVIVICLAVVIRKRKKRIGKEKIGGEKEKERKRKMMMEASEAAEAMRKEQDRELDEKVKRAAQLGMAARSGNLAFCAGEAAVYSLDQLMRASAELLGRGSVGTTYKAVLDNRLIVCVKRLDAAKLAGTTREAFESHMESVGGLRHPNLVPLRAYFQAKDERLLVYDYCPNGSLHSLIHGSKSSRAKPLHWTSCLKIAEDVAQGLSYIHQAWRLVHGGLKSRNVLLGPDFEACISDYCLSALLTHHEDGEEDEDDSAYKAPETQQGSKADVYAFGVLLLELVTGKPPSQLAMAAAEGDPKMEMLVEVAVACSAASPEKRPAMWQVMKMLQEIKESVSADDHRQQEEEDHANS